MRKVSTLLLAAITISGIAACATRPPAVSTSPTPTTSGTAGKSASTPVAGKPTPTVSRQTWNFSYLPGSYTYTIATTANIALQSDSAARQTLPNVSEQVTLKIRDNGEAEVTDPAPSNSLICDSTAALVTRAQQLLPRIPQHLTVHAMWSDSSVTTGCRGTIPTTVKAAYTYAVLPETLYKGIQAVHVTRSDTISAQGTGSEGQHQIALSANGIGFIDFYFDPASGVFLGSVNQQVTKLNITTSGQTGHFLQHVVEEVALKK